MTGHGRQRQQQDGKLCSMHTGNGPGQEGAGQQLKEVAGLSDSVSSIRKRRSEAGCRARWLGQEGAGQQLKEVACLRGSINLVRKRRSEAGRRPRAVGAACFKFIRYLPGQRARAGRRWIVAQGSYRSKRLNQFRQWAEVRSRAHAPGIRIASAFLRHWPGPQKGAAIEPCEKPHEPTFLNQVSMARWFV